MYQEERPVGDGVRLFVVKTGRAFVSLLLLCVALGESNTTAQVQRSCAQGLVNPGECWEQIEKELIALYPDLFHREGPTLFLRFGNKQEEKFVTGETEPDRETSIRTYLLPSTKTYKIGAKSGYRSFIKTEMISLCAMMSNRS